MGSSGQAWMQALQPMQREVSKSTIPSARLNIAVVGQTFTHGASAQWLQRRTATSRRVSGKVPRSTYLTQVRLTPRGTSFSDLQAVVQAWQPMHEVWSMTQAKLVTAGRTPDDVHR